jgi:hypothetical protein
MTYRGYSTKVRCKSTIFALIALILLQSFPAHAAQTTSSTPNLTVQVVEGQGAINNVKRGTAFEPIVEVRDQQGNPVSGAAVIFTLPAVGPGATFSDGSKTLMTRTDANGRATARGMRPNALAGEFDIRVSASYSGQSGSTTFSQTNASPAAAERSSAKKWVVLLGIAGGAAAAGMVATRGGKSTTPAAAAADPATGSITPGAPGFGPPR